MTDERQKQNRAIKLKIQGPAARRWYEVIENE